MASWAKRLGGNIELVIADRDDWTYQRRGDPPLAPGSVCRKELYEKLSSTDLRTWREPLEIAGFTVALPQAQALADFATSAVAALKPCDPAIKGPPKAKPRRRMKAGPADDPAAEPEAPGDA